MYILLSIIRVWLNFMICSWTRNDSEDDKERKFARSAVQYEGEATLCENWKEIGRCADGAMRMMALV